MKFKLSLFIAAVFLFGACQNDATKGEVKATSATATTPKEVSPAEAILKTVKANPNAHEENAGRLNKAATLLAQDNKSQQAMTVLVQAVRNYYSGTKTADNALMMASLYKDKFNKPELSQVVHQALGQAFKDNDAVKRVLEKNPVSIPAFSDFLKNKTGKLTNAETGKIDRAVAGDYIAACELRAMLLPNDAANAGHLHKAGEIAGSMRAYPKAIELYQWVYNKYPDSKKASQALFMTAFTLDDKMKQADRAKKVYEDFLKKYPNDDFSDDAKFLLENIGKSNEEIIESFGKQK